MASRLTALIVVGIVAVTLVAGLIVGAQRDDDSGPVDLLIVNGRVYPADGSGTFADAVAIRANQVLRVGSNRELKRLRGIGTTVIDAHGGAVLPGFNDSHAHFLAGGLASGSLDLRSATTLEEIEQAVRAYSERHPSDEWILGRGWRFRAFPDGLPTRQQLDAVVPDRPVYVVAEDGHTGWANSRALAEAGITRRTQNPPHGSIVKDPRSGEPTGALKDSARSLIERVLPTPTDDEALDALRSAIAEAHRHGITSVQDVDGTADEFDWYDELRQEDALKVRIYGILGIQPGSGGTAVDRLDEVLKRFSDDPLLKAGAVRLEVDGSIESHTAAMLAPYANKRTTGHLVFTLDQLRRLVALLDRRGWQILIDATGDAAARLSLDALEDAVTTNPTPARGRRHRLERLEAIDPVDLSRLRASGTIASLQPFRSDVTADPLQVWAANVGAERASRGWPWRSIGEAGGRLAFGSDWPAGSLDPLVGLQVAITHGGGQAGEASGHGQALPLITALDAYTRGAAYASFDEQRKGTLARGMLADLVILSADIFSLPPERLSDARVETTIFDGRVVYSRNRTLTIAH
ncbi:MAG: amidohydrolase [Acidobacteria bacterium]|nr:amidohydrolase [Acidobacteriota bacterium]